MNIRAYLAIAFTKHLVGDTYILDSNSKLCQIMYSDHINGGFTAEGFDLVRGSCVAQSTRPCEISLGDLVLVLPADAIVHLAKEKQITRINYLAGRPGFVKAPSRKVAFRISAGEELRLASDLSASSEKIAHRRNTIECILNDGSQLIMAEFSFLSLFKKSSLLRLISKSPRYSNHMAAILKTTAALTLVTSSHGAFHDE